MYGCTPASEIYRQQQQLSAEKQNERKKEWIKTTNKANKAGWFRNLIFWVHSEPEMLNERLGKRVEEMVSQGLFAEIFELWEYFNSLNRRGTEVNLEKGVWQSIGFKEFLPWLQARKEFGIDEDMPSKANAGAGPGTGCAGGVGAQVEAEDVSEKLKKEGLEKMKVATVQYAKTQVKWIRIKLINALKEANEDGQEEKAQEASGSVLGESGYAGGGLTDAGEKTKGNTIDCDAISASSPDCNSTMKKSSTQPLHILYLLDSSDASQFSETVSYPAISIAKSFLCPPSTNTNNNNLPDPLSLSNLAASCLQPKRNYDLSKRQDLWVKRTCEFCGVTTIDEDGWKKHEGGARHRRKSRGRAKWEEGRQWKRRREQEVEQKKG